MHIVEGGVCAVPGVTAFGLKQDENGVAILIGGGQAAGVFTSNRVKAAPILVTRDHLAQGSQIAAVIVNSGSANAFTGSKGIEDARHVASALATRLGLRVTQVAVASTGVIGQPLDVEWIVSRIDEMLPQLSDTPAGSLEAAKAIMTTDSIPKQIAVEADGIRIGGVAKGAGMIEPDLCTMLAFVYTDAPLTAEVLKTSIERAVSTSFNMAVVDGDTSTNDMVLLISTDKSTARIDVGQFQNALDFVCVQLAKMIVRDGEGATKMMEVTVKGAREREDAIKAAKAVVRSPLVKTALFGADPNWGRIIAAVGYSGAYIEPELLSLTLSDGRSTSVVLIDRGRVHGMHREYDQKALQHIMNGAELSIVLDLGVGCEGATAWGCDLTCDYIRVNAEYST